MFKDEKFIFPKWANLIPIIILIVGISVVATAHFAPFILSASFLEKGYSPVQPIPFSHKLHAGKLGMDCRYCHTGAEKSFEAMVPPTSTCMNCHAYVKKDSEKLKPLFDAHEKGEAVAWVRVHDLPDYVKFPHKSHVQAGLKCQTCHGPVESMERVKVDNPMSMSWCLQCHRRHGNEEKMDDILSEKIISENRTISQIFSTHWEDVKKTDGKVVREGFRNLKDLRDFRPPTHCSGCHQ